MTRDTTAEIDRPPPTGVVAAAIACCAMSIALAACGPERASGPLTHEAYLWQRAWTPQVEEAVTERAPRFRRVVVLAAEVGWERGRREVARAAIDWPRLRAVGVPVGLALRVGPFAPRSEDHEEAGAALAALAAELVAEARAAGVEPAEVQLDFDAATAALGDYGRWLEAARAALGDTPLTITALPTWLDSPGLPALLRQVDGYVLQVHSVARPTGPDALEPLTDPAAARRWIEAAAKLGRPFRVALPTYGYRLGFGPDGAYLGVTADAPARPWPEGAITRELRADAPALADLVAALEADRPALLEGLIWYRLPVDGEALNWGWATLEALLDGRPVAPRLRLRVDLEGGLAHVVAVNEGLADAPLPASVAIAWRGAPPLAADAVGGYLLTDDLAATRLARAPDAPEHLPAGGERPIAWLRFAAPVTLEDLNVRSR